eukprot:1966791-Pleurochrysis_carterae.AAC.1
MSPRAFMNRRADACARVYFNAPARQSTQIDVPLFACPDEGRRMFVYASAREWAVAYARFYLSDVCSVRACISALARVRMPSGMSSRLSTMASTNQLTTSAV